MTKKEIVMICDRSGSMASKIQMTVDGINTTVKELKTDENSENINFSLKFFNDRDELKIRSLNINKVKDCVREDINPRGTTALLDAIGNTINYFIEKKRRNEDAYESCLIYVITDGLENSSQIYNHITLKQIINMAEISYNITILYLGSNQDAIFEASKFGVSSERAMNFTENVRSMPNMYAAIAASAQRSISGQEPNFTNIERTQSQVQ